jgi:hypothetical protein
VLQVDYFPFLSTIFDSSQQSIDSLLYNRLQAQNSLLRKHRIPRCATLAMKVMVNSSYSRHIGAKPLSLPVPDISLLFISVYLIVKVGIGNMDLFGIDSDNWTVFFVQFANLEDILATVDTVVEEFVPFSLV